MTRTKVLFTTINCNSESKNFKVKEKNVKNKSLVSRSKLAQTKFQCFYSVYYHAYCDRHCVVNELHLTKKTFCLFLL